MPPKTRSNARQLSPVPVAGFMPPPPKFGAKKPKNVEVVVKPKSSKPAVKKRAVPAPTPSKATAARDIELAARALLKLSKQLKPQK